VQKENEYVAVPKNIDDAPSDSKSETTSKEVEFTKSTNTDEEKPLSNSNANKEEQDRDIMSPYPKSTRKRKIAASLVILLSF